MGASYKASRRRPEPSPTALAATASVHSAPLFTKLEKIIRGRPGDHAEAIFRMRILLTEKRASLPSGYMNQPRLLSAYICYHLPLHLPEMGWILEQCFARGQLRAPRTITELGSGPGTASLGASLWLMETLNHRPQELAFFDQSRLALEIARELAASILPDTKLYKVRGNLFSRTDRAKLLTPADWLIVSHVLNEVGNGPRYRQTKLELLEKLVVDHMDDSEGNALFIVEPPLREPTMDLMWLRDEMNSPANPFWSEQFEVVAPCPRNARLCPMALSKLGWCYAQPPRTWARTRGLAPWDSELEQVARIELSHPGFSYLVIRRRGEIARAGLHGIALSDPTRLPSFVCRGTQIKREGQVPHRGAYLKPRVLPGETADGLPLVPDEVPDEASDDRADRWSEADDHLRDEDEGFDGELLDEAPLRKASPPARSGKASARKPKAPKKP